MALVIGTEGRLPVGSDLTGGESHFCDEDRKNAEEPEV